LAIIDAKWFENVDPAPEQLMPSGTAVGSRVAAT